MQLTFFSDILSRWYKAHQRKLPWRQTNDPYKIWLSEIILQQTRVGQGLPYYMRFVERFPNVASLAAAEEDEILKLWQGLGYYNRARNMHYAAKQIVAKFGGKFPENYDDVIGLKGIGEYTAAAIVSFAYNQPYAAIDGNVYRVVSRVFGVEEYIDTAAGKKVFKDLSAELLNEKEPGLYNQAIMDFGALQCVPATPDCAICPFGDKCYAYANGVIKELPKKKGKTKVNNRYFNYLDIRVEGFAFLKKREDKDIWRGLFEFPLIESTKELIFEDLTKTKEYQKFIEGVKKVELTRSVKLKHILSHQIIYANFYQLQVDQFQNNSFEKVKEDDLHTYAISKMIDNYLVQLP